jgi:hypothetical protein
MPLTESERQRSQEIANGNFIVAKCEQYSQDVAVRNKKLRANQFCNIRRL